MNIFIENHRLVLKTKKNKKAVSRSKDLTDAEELEKIVHLKNKGHD